MNSETKLFLGIIAATIVLLGGAIFYFSRPAGSTQGVDMKLLIREDSNKTSAASAAVTLVEFGDFQCPACGAYHPIVQQLLKEFHDDMVFVFRNFPLPLHANSVPAAQAAESAGKQGKYWEMYDMLYEKQKDWSSVGNPQEVFTGYASSLGINSETFKKDMDDTVIKKKIDGDTQDGQILGVNATPTFFLNGEKLENPGSLDDFRALIKAAILKAPKPSITATSAYHTHFNLRIVADGKAYDLTLPRFQSTEEKELNPDIHLHDGNGEVVHIHKKGVSLADLLTSVGLNLTKTCFLYSAEARQTCSTDTTVVALYVNGEKNNEYAYYVPQDLDRLLLYVGKNDEALIKEQVNLVADTACIYSEKCPERGKPPTENCVGGLGTGCKE